MCLPDDYGVEHLLICLVDLCISLKELSGFFCLFSDIFTIQCLDHVVFDSSSHLSILRISRVRFLVERKHVCDDQKSASSILVKVPYTFIACFYLKKFLFSF